MRPITFKRALMLYVDAVLENNIAPLLYLKDGDSHYHKVSSIDIADIGRKFLNQEVSNG